MESKKINQLATELAPELSDLTIIGDPTTGISKKITLSQMASLFTGTVEEYANLASFPLVGTADTIYIALDTNIIYRWNTGTSAYVELSPNIVTSLVFNDANGFDGTISLVGSTATLTITTALTTGSVGFIGASGALLEDNANFFWNNSTKRLGIGTNAPTTAIDAFGSGIIGRLNGTSTNNAFLGFASAGSNKWSIGNVQSDHRFRIYSEATTSELVSVLQTGEVGIGIANPLTKLHIFGGASALIANLDANTSVAKSISFRSGNSSRINLEVSGTESGSNAGMNFFLRTYTDAGSLLETPFQIIRSTGVTTIKSLTLTNALSIANGGTGSTTQNFVDLTTTQSIGGAKTFTSDITIDNGAADGGQLILASSGFSNWNIDNFSGSLRAYYGSTERLRLTASGFLGIGTGTPLAPLHINYDLGTTNAALRLTNGTAANASNITKIAFFTVNTFGGAEESAAIFAINPNANTNNGGHLVFATSAYSTASTAIEKMRITNTGYIGMGTASPLTKLQLVEVGGPSVIPTLTISQDGDLGLDWVAGALNFYSYDGSTNSKGGIGHIRVAAETAYNTGYTPSYMAFYTHPYSANNNTTLGAATEKMRISANGNVGIGTTSPSNKLDVRNSGDFDVKFRSEAAGGTVGLVLETANTFSGTSQAFIKAIGNAGNGQSQLIFGTAGSNGDTTATERMRIRTDGNVGIGSSTAASSIVRLVVQGQSNTGSDYSLIATDNAGGTALGVRNDKIIIVPGVYTYNYASTANVFVQSDGVLGRNSSSLKYKKNIEDYSKGLDYVLKLRPVLYESKNPYENSLKFTGFIAEEVDKIGLNELVHYDNNEPDSLHYPHFVALLTKAIQEQQVLINELKAKLG